MQSVVDYTTDGAIAMVLFQCDHCSTDEEYTGETLARTAGWHITDDEDRCPHCYTPERTMHEHHCPHCGHCVNLPGVDCYPTTPNANIPCPGCPRVYYLDCIPARG